MKDRLPLIVIVIMVIVFIGAMVTVVLMQNGSYKSKADAIESEAAAVQKKVDEITSAKDVNNFTPTEVVSTFLTEVKSDATARAKLYLTSTVQDMDIKNTLKLGSDLSNMIIGDSEQTISGDTANVIINLEVGSDQVSRTFSIEKADGAWKINGITAE